MLAKIEKHSNHHIATFHRHINSPLEDVWAMLTTNEKLALWFDELRVVDLEKGGYFSFNLGNGTFEKMTITDYIDHTVLEFTWGDDLVRFELKEVDMACQLLLKETINKLTPHTPKDLAGWHVCLDVITSILNHQEIEDRMKIWEFWFEKYSDALSKLS
ncbi:SRPBCC family protein [Ornithinibacillus bavariensis]|uniref:SRPBCC family protein n=1 Tax=Ornithinibacillus bavariensis TaxID=545502 RepID=UPI003D23E7A4